MQVPGLARNVPIVLTDSNVLVKVRTALKRGQRLFALVDTRLGCEYSPNLLRVAGKSASQVVFFSTELEGDGTIAVRFLRPPDPFCRTEAGIHKNLQFLHREIRGILERPASAGL